MEEKLKTEQERKCGIKSQHAPPHTHTHAHRVSDNALGVDSTYTASKARLCDLKVKKRAVLNPQDFQNVNEQINFLGGGAEKPQTPAFSVLQKALGIV